MTSFLNCNSLFLAVGILTPLRKSVGIWSLELCRDSGSLCVGKVGAHLGQYSGLSYYNVRLHSHAYSLAGSVASGYEEY